MKPEFHPRKTSLGHTGTALLLAGVALFATLPARADKEDIAQAGDIIQILLPLGGAGYATYAQDWEGLNQYVYAFTTSWATTYALKLSVGRMRPSYSNTQSYPSGHTMAAFSGASFIQRRYGEGMGGWQWSPYLAAGFVGWSRVYASAHHTGDVAAGAILGILPTYTFVTPFGTKGAIKPYSSSTGTGLKVSASLPASGRAEDMSFRDVLKWPGYAFEIPKDSIFEDPADLGRNNLARTRLTFDSEVMRLDEDAAGWVSTNFSFGWAVSPSHELSIEVPYVESDLPGASEIGGSDFTRGLGDIRLGYKWTAYNSSDVTSTYQGASLGLIGILPTGDEEGDLGSGTTVLAPYVTSAFSFADGKVGFFPSLAYLHSTGETDAQSIPTDTLIRPGIAGLDEVDNIRSIVMDLPLTWRIGDRWTIGGGFGFEHDFDPGYSSWMANLIIGFKIAETANFRVDYGEVISSDSALFGRFRMLAAVYF